MAERPIAKNISTTTLISSQTGTGAGDGFDLPCKKTVQIDGITTGTVKIQGSNDDTNYYDLATATADGLYEVDAPYVYTRVNVTVATDVDVTAIAAYELD